MRRFIILFSILCLNSWGSNFNIEVYQKCHKQFTNSRVKKNSEVIKLISKKELSAPKACIELIKRASLDENYQLKIVNKETKAILKNIQTLHNSWFKLHNLNRETQDHSVTNVIDSNQMAYHYTASLLANNYQYSNIFTTTDTFWAVREGNENNLFSNDKDISGERSRIDGSAKRKWQVGGVEDNPDDYGARYFWKPKLVEFGELIGLRKIKEHLYFERLREGRKLNKSSLTQNLFPGVFGSSAYLILNLGHDNQTTDGGNKLHRRFANNLFSDFLCRNLPALESEDIQVIKKSKISFRKSTNCMSCHQTMDQLALLSTNLEPFNAGEVHTNAFTFRSIYQHPTPLQAEHRYVDSDKDFYKKKHLAKLYFRDFQGNLINRDILAPKDLGLILKELDDPYLCTSARYFQFLTGISVNMNQFNQLTGNLKIKKTLMRLTSILKSEQKPMRVLEEIISSEFYISKNREATNE
ncbi:hypothetical protein [Halobacteriovorax marinus]|uniref:hypothetical protein n=1 Tax=Halobacteriovorax marinus TaxID=97084 RepID=UPI003A8E1449